LLQILKKSGVQIVDGNPSYVELPEETWSQMDKKFHKFKKCAFKFAAEVGAIYGFQLHSSYTSYTFYLKN
jgi:hypothetical protein